MQITVAGPSGAGKTMFLCALLRAYAAAGQAQRVKVRPDPGSEAALQLSEAAGTLLTGGQLPATTAVTHYRFFIDLPGSLFGLGARSATLNVADVPGGDCLPDPPARADPAVIQLASSASALLLLLPATGPSTGRETVRAAREFLAEVAQVKRPRQGEPLYKRVALGLTQAELLVADRGGRALATLERLDPLDVASHVYGNELISLLQGVAPPGGLLVTLASAFGFRARSGEVACVQEGSGWRLPTLGPELDWMPFRVYEPLEFLARGMVWRGLWSG